MVSYLCKIYSKPNFADCATKFHDFFSFSRCRWNFSPWHCLHFFNGFASMVFRASAMNYSTPHCLPAIHWKSVHHTALQIIQTQQTEVPSASASVRRSKWNAPRKYNSTSNLIAVSSWKLEIIMGSWQTIARWENGLSTSIEMPRDANESRENFSLWNSEQSAHFSGSSEKAFARVVMVVLKTFTSSVIATYA